METFKVEAKSFGKKIEVPTSKSYANRALVLAALKPEEICLNNMPDSTDVAHMLKCFEQIGLAIERDGYQVRILNSFPTNEKESEYPVELQTGDGGTTNRFLIALLARGKNTYRVFPTHRMKDRPMQVLYEGLRRLGVSVRTEEVGEAMVEVQGPPDAKKLKDYLEVDCSESTQFIMALALAFSDCPLSFRPKDLEASEDYWKLSQRLIENFHQSSVKEYDIPVDFSSLSYPIALGVVSGGAHITNCKTIDRLQADSRLLDYLGKMGVKWSIGQEGLKISESQDYLGVKMDCSLSPDLFPTMAFLAAYAQTSSEFTSMKVLHYKESDRVKETLGLLDIFGVKYDYLPAKERLVIQGNTPKVGPKECKPPADHRMVMLGYLFLRVNDGGTLHNPESVEKSFSGFYKIME